MAVTEFFFAREPFKINPQSSDSRGTKYLKQDSGSLKKYVYCFLDVGPGPSPNLCNAIFE